MRLWFLLLLLISISAYGRQEDVYRYPDGRTKYVLSYDNDSLVTTTYLSSIGDTIYSWNIPSKQIIEFSFLGEYLLGREYDSLKSQRRMALTALKNGAKIPNAYLSQTPHAIEWKKMHDQFFVICPAYTYILREGDFTISIASKNGIPNGMFKKYYKGKLVTEGRFDNGSKSGLWHYYPYYFYPYKDITVFDTFGKEYSVIYSFLPAVISIFLLLLGFVVAGRTGNYNGFFYSVLGIAIITLLLRLCIPFDRYNVWIRHTIPALWFIFWQAMIAICTIDLFIIKKTNTRPIVNVICLLFGIGFSIYIILFKHLDF
ncbi:MAG: hypothetical protein P4L41_08455 [Flavipsychrobacter sp.]|nr:hypothetical protein [Flavipsychrobacter sp.]